MTTRLAICLASGAAALAFAGVPAPAAAQSPAPPDVFLHGVPAGEPTSTPLALSLADAIHRGLDQNLGVILEQERLHATESARLSALADLLPHLSANVHQSDQKVNLAAFGFTGFPGIPQVIGPFGVFDARVALSTPLFDAAALGDLHESSALVEAEEHSNQFTRATVILVVGNLYLQAVANAARVDAATAQVTTAEALVQLAQDQQASGLVAGIDVLRQQVQLESARSQLISDQNALDKGKLVLARAIGLPAGQPYTLSDKMPYTPAPAMTIDQAVETATASRDDLKAAVARVAAARAARQAAVGSALPTVHLDADYGAIGSSVSTTTPTFTVAADVHVPIFQGGDTRAKVRTADAEPAQRQAELADLRAGVRYDVAAALLDVTSADAGVHVADSARTLAAQQLTQAQDRFRAGVASTIELVQAQDAVSTATERYIASVYAHNLAKAALARALGQVEQRFLQLVGGHN
jgi:outer membrane protein TolC